MAKRLRFEFPDFAEVLEDLAKPYDCETERWGTESEKDRGLQH